ncbi:MAG: A/G-specific adenine glycosylase [Acidobacteria bacterium]|nr:A/G-specific adenine glycosylase [Acidobacteriota bacterium]
MRRALRRASVVLRRDLPWVGHDDPWAIFVSEVMLQQTSTSRVMEPWRRFIAFYPTPASCARAPLSDILRLWQGLGYPRRAKSLHDAARTMVEDFAGAVPSAPEDLRRLPGVGPYTAHAVASFAFERRVAVVDTNVGRVLARALANRPLRAREAQHLAESLLPRSQVAAFNQAMLDLGAQHCTKVPKCAHCPVQRQCRWRREGGGDPAPASAGVSRPQAAFAGSDRQVRGRMMAVLGAGPVNRRTFARQLADVDPTRRERLLAQLVRDGLVRVGDQRVSLSGDDPSRH